MGKDGGGGSSTVVTSSSILDKPKSFLEAVEHIQEVSAMEASTENPINALYFSTKKRWDIWIVGFKGAFVNGLIVALLTPFAIGVSKNLVPIFGEAKPSIFSQVYAIVLALSFSLGYGMFLATLRHCYVGSVAKIMIKNFFGGVFVGGIIKALLAVLIFHLLYLWLTPEVVIKIFKFFLRLYPEWNYLPTYYWLFEFKPVLLISAWFIVGSTILFILIPTTSVVVTTLINRKKEEIK